MKNKKLILTIIITISLSYQLGSYQGFNRGIQSAKNKRIQKARWLADAQAGSYKYDKENKTKREKVYSKCRQQIEAVSGLFVSTFELVKTFADK